MRAPVLTGPSSGGCRREQLGSMYSYGCKQWGVQA